MTISVQCPFCEERAELRDSERGRTMRCPACRETYTVLGAEDPAPDGLTPTLPHVAKADAPDPWRDPLPGKRGSVRPWVRFWARILEMVVWGEVLWAAIWWGGLLRPWESQVTENWLLVGFGYACLVRLSWVPLETLLLGTWGTTPGKWLLRIQVARADGRRLSPGDALRRSFHVYWRGMALGIWVLEFVGWILAFLELGRSGKTPWDARGNLVVTHRRIGLARILVLIALLVAPALARGLARVL